MNSLDDPSLGVRQEYTLEKVKAGGVSQTLLKDAIASPTNTGRTLMPDYGTLRTQAMRRLEWVPLEFRYAFSTTGWSFSVLPGSPPTPAASRHMCGRSGWC